MRLVVTGIFAFTCREREDQSSVRLPAVTYGIWVSTLTGNACLVSCVNHFSCCYYPRLNFRLCLEFVAYYLSLCLALKFYLRSLRVTIR